MPRLAIEAQVANIVNQFHIPSEYENEKSHCKFES